MSTVLLEAFRLSKGKANDRKTILYFSTGIESYIFYDKTIKTIPVNNWRYVMAGSDCNLTTTYPTSEGN